MFLWKLFNHAFYAYASGNQQSFELSHYIHLQPYQKYHKIIKMENAVIDKIIPKDILG